MAETNGDKYGYFFNSENGDRKYNATSVEMWLKKFFTSGVFYGDLQVTANDDMTVTSASGYANTEGKVRLFSSGENLVIETAHATYDRIDTIVVERNDTDRQIIRKVVKGGYSSKPEPTAPVRSDGVYQLVLAEIYVAAGATSITQSVITDKRADKAVCGYVVCPVDNFDFNQFTTQCNAFLTEFKQEEKERFITWFDDIKNQLSGDVAANLQLQIGTLDALKTENKSNLVAAINEVNEKDIDVLDTREEIQANTTPGKVAGALPVKELYSSLIWKLIGTATQSNPVSINKEYNEIIACCYNSAVNNYRMVHIPYIALGDTPRSYVLGATSETQVINVSVSKTEAKIAAWNNIKASILQNATLKLYGR